MDPPRRERGRFHLDVYVPAEQAPARVEACLAAGGRLVTDAHAPSWWVLADPEGNELCVCVQPDPVLEPDADPRG
jgi:4a-hydroxytetrahydrobiopterin dehydratase